MITEFVAGPGSIVLALGVGLAVAGLAGWAVQRMRVANLLLRSELTDELATRNALVQSEARYRRIVDRAADVIYCTDAEGTLTFVNAATVDVTGYSRQELLGRSYLTLVRPDCRELAREFYTKQSVERIANTYYDLPVVTNSGEDVWLGQHVQLLTDGARVTGFQALARDVSGWMRIQRDLQGMRDAALETARLKSEFVANTSHEIRTPLNGIVGFASLLLDTDLSAEQRKYADGLRLSTDTLLTIVNDILDFSKIEAGMLPLETTSFDLRTVADNTVTMFAESSRSKGIALDVRIDDGVHTRVKGDPGRLRQVLTNLVGNAVKFTDHGSVAVRMATETQTEHGIVLRVTVSDTGIGIDPSMRPHLFQAFVQADGSTSRRYGGTGLGLAICRQLVGLMGGTIAADSAPGRGSTFSFTVQLEKDHQPAATRGVEATDLRGKSLLVVDDSPTSRKELADHAATWGLVVGEAESGQQALELLRGAAAGGRPYQLAILSLANPEMDGMALAREIMADPSIALTRLVLIPRAGVRGQALEARETGIVAYLPRPVQMSELLRCLTTVMDEHVGRFAPDGSGGLITRHSLDEQRTAQVRYRILVADDNAVSRDVTQLQIEKLGYQVDTAGNGLEAVEAAGHVPYDLIFMDCQMPIMDGFAATAEIRRREAGRRRVPVVAFTANVIPGEQVHCLQAGMDDFVGKPVRKADLVDVLGRHLSGSPSAARTASLADNVSPPEVGATSAAVLHELEEEMGAERLTQMIERHLANAESTIALVERAIASGDSATVKREVHRLKGGSLTLGFLRLASLCARLEDEVDDWTRAEQDRVVQQLKSAGADLRRWHQQERSACLPP